MVSIRAAKAKGSSFEYDCQHSLKAKHPEVYRTAERGFQMQYDLHVEDSLTTDTYVFECKRLKGISWNQLVKFYEKLEKVTPDADDRFLLFQSNRQPCLVFTRLDGYKFIIMKFEYVFGVPFEKHPSTRVTKK